MTSPISPGDLMCFTEPFCLHNLGFIDNRHISERVVNDTKLLIVVLSVDVIHATIGKQASYSIDVLCGKKLGSTVIHYPGSKFKIA